MPKKIEIENDSWWIGGGHTSWIRDIHGWTEGSVATRSGIVRIYSQGDADTWALTTLRIVHNGRLYARSIRGKRYSHRGLITLAKRYAKEITSIGGHDV